MDPFAAILSAFITAATPTSAPTTIPGSPELVSPWAEKGVLMANMGGDPGGMMNVPPPTLTVNVRRLDSQLSCMQRARTQIYSTGATNVRSDNDSYWGNYGSTVAMIWCLSNGQAIIVGAGQGATPQQAVNAITAGF